MGDDEMVGYSDVDGASTEGRHTISGYIFMLNGGAVSWPLKCQELVTLSTTEAEYVALTHKQGSCLALLIHSQTPQYPQASHTSLV